MKQLGRQKRKQPLVSIVMPVYNAAGFLAEAIESIKNQTYQNWELFCFDDLSTDESWKMLKRFSREDRRIKAFRNGKHRGVAGAANEALKHARGQYIARMDADDVALPNRLAVQVAYLNQHPEVIAVGGQCRVIDRSGREVGEKRFPTDPERVYQMIFSSIPLQQPTLMVDRNRLPDDFVWYVEGMRTAEEVELLFKLFSYGQVANVEETVLWYRIHGNNVSLKEPKKTFFLTLKTRIKAVFAYGYRPTMKGILVTCLQTLAVTLLPSKWIYPVYSVLRGLREVGFKIVIKPALAWLQVK